MNRRERSRFTRRRLDCDESRLLASVCLDGEANDLEEAALARHLRRCPECRDFVEQAQIAQRLTRSAVLDPSFLDAAAERVTERIVADGRRGRVAHLRERWMVGSAGTAVAVAMLLAVFVWGFGEQPARETQTLALPQVLAGRTLDPSYVPYLEQRLGSGKIMIAAGTADEKLLFFESPMSFHEEFHYRPEEL